MLLEPLWTAFRFVQSEDTIRFHVTLFRCFLLGLLDTQHDFPLPWVVAVLAQRLAQMGLAQDVGDLHDAVSSRAFCSPKKRYGYSNDTTSWPSFATTAPPADQMTSLPSLIVSQLINMSHGLHHSPLHAAAAIDLLDSPWCWTWLAPAYPWSLLGSGPVLVGDDGPLIGVVGCVLLWLLTISIVVSHRLVRSNSTPVVAAESTINSGALVILPLAQEHLLTDEAIQSRPADRHRDIGRQVLMPGAWLHKRQEQEQDTFEMFEGCILESMLWLLLAFCARMGMRPHFPGWASIFTVWGPLDRGSKAIIVIGRNPKDCCASARSGLASDGLDPDASVSVPTLYSRTGRGATQDLYGSTTITEDRCMALSVTGQATTKNRDSPETAARETMGGLIFSNVGRRLCQEEISFNAHDNASEDRPNGEVDGLSGINPQRADSLPLEKTDAYLNRRQEWGCPLLLRRAHGAGDLFKKYDVSDDDEGIDDDSYWTEQVDARLSDESSVRQASYQYGWSDALSWPQEGRKDETDNWRTRSSKVIHVAAHEETIEAVWCQTNNTKLRRYSSPQLNVDALPSYRVGSEDGPQGIYVVPQKRGRTMGGRYWSPGSSPRPSGCPGLGFFPFGKAPALLTPEAWRPGCLYISDPPADEARHADAWLDSMTSDDGCRNASAAGERTWDAGAVQDRPERRPRFSRNGYISWRDRYENNPASRRFVSGHRRVATEG